MKRLTAVCSLLSAIVVLLFDVWSDKKRSGTNGKGNRSGDS